MKNGALCPTYAFPAPRRPMLMPDGSPFVAALGLAFSEIDPLMVRIKAHSSVSDTDTEIDIR